MPMSNPIVVEVKRGNLVESIHRGAVAVAGPDGALLAALGDVERAVYPRSAIKLLQAIPLIETGAADAYGFGNRQLALACSSHSGEPEHTAMVAAMLQAAAIDERALRCGAHEPISGAATRALARRRLHPLPLHNNCSGKHAGMLATARHRGEPLEDYCDQDHPVQRRIASVIDEISGVATATAPCGIDGCSVPTWALPLAATAGGFARLASGHGVDAARLAAARRLMAAVIAEPFYVAGSNRFCTKAIAAAGGKAFVKTGAEGVFCAVLPDLGLAIALKIDDGGSRASEVVMATLLLSLLGGDGRLAAAGQAELGELAAPSLLNVRGVEVGAVTAAADLISFAAGLRG